MKRILIITIFTILSIATIRCRAQMDVTFADEKSDTTQITAMLVDVDAMQLGDNGKIISELALRFIGTPYKAATLEGNDEHLRARIDTLDCTTFVETTLAMAMTIAQRRTSWRDFIYNLRQLRYRGGKIDGYASRLHYVSDWIVDCNHRGIVQEMTARIVDRPDYEVKTLDFMSRNHNKYAALADSANLAAIKNVEVGYRSHRYPMIKTMNIKNARLNEGDVVAFTTKIKNLDVTHMGIITVINGTPHLIHASSKAGKVISDPLPLSEYLRRNHAVTGIRVIRLKD